MNLFHSDLSEPFDRHAVIDVYRHQLSKLLIKCGSNLRHYTPNNNCIIALNCVRNLTAYFAFERKCMHSVFGAPQRNSPKKNNPDMKLAISTVLSVYVSAFRLTYTYISISVAAVNNRCQFRKRRSFLFQQNLNTQNGLVDWINDTVHDQSFLFVWFFESEAISIFQSEVGSVLLRFLGFHH